MMLVMLKRTMAHDGSEQYMDYYNVRAFFLSSANNTQHDLDGGDAYKASNWAANTYISFGLKDTFRENHSVALAS